MQLILVVQVHQPHQTQDPAHSHDLACLVSRGVAGASGQEGDIIRCGVAAATADAVQAIDHRWNVQQHGQGCHKVNQPADSARVVLSALDNTMLDGVLNAQTPLECIERDECPANDANNPYWLGSILN